MIKFEWNLPDPHVLGITNDPGLSRPYKVASLNLQFTRLLSALGIPDQVFLDKTRTYLQEVAKLDQCPGPLNVQIKFLCANQYVHICIPRQKSGILRIQYGHAVAAEISFRMQ